MKLLVDTDIILDLMFDCAEDRIEVDSFSEIMADKTMERFCTVSCIEEIICTARGILGSDELARAVAVRLMRLVIPLDSQMEDVVCAMDSEMTETDKAIYAYAALRNGIDVILTSNVESFYGSPVRVTTPSKFLKECL
ncbi:MAG: hypothetical protein KRP56_06475 [Candidatus Methanogranum gryphiswaldense]|jgi:hypothetical protein|nr:MAG: hypothetical protein KRP56_06475 [Candidatus Methanogranum sp. U3.2.1]